MIKSIQIIFFIGLLFSAIFVKSQSTLSLEIMTVGVHAFEKPNFALFENSLDAEGNLCAEPGLLFNYETFVSENRASFEFSTSAFADAGGQFAGYTEIAFKRLFFHKWRSSMYLSVGPALTYRNTWNRLSYGNIVYAPETNYYNDGNWEIRPTVIGKFQYAVFLGRNSDITLGILYGHSYKTFTATLGYRYWLSTKVKRTRKCNCDKDKYKKKFKDYFW